MFALTRLRARQRTRGQSLVELALILPVILLIVLVAIDFGRAFSGYVTLTNATRIGANYAASHPTAWDTPGNPDRDEYEELILRDTDVANCDLVPEEPVAPKFTDGSDTGTSSTDVGDRVDVGLSCTFQPITPIISAIVGSSLMMSANSDFAVRAGTVAGVPIPPPAPPGPTPTPGPGTTPTPTPTPTPPCLTVPNLAAPAPETVGQARAEWNAAGFTGSFSPNGQNNKTVLNQTIAPGSCAAPSSAISVTYS